MPNFVEITSTVAEISRFFDISRWRHGVRRHDGFLKFQIVNGRKGQEG